MTEIKGTNREFLEMLKGFEEIKSIESSKAFAILVARNIEKLTKHLNPIENLAIPKKEFVELARKVNQFIEAGDQEAVKAIEEENRELIKGRESQLKAVQDELDKTSAVEINLIEFEHFPETISAEKIQSLLKIIKDGIN